MRSDKASSAGKHLAINTASRRLSHYDGNRLIKEYPVAVGKPSTPTPNGSYKIKNKVVDPGGVLGTRWMGMDIPGGNYGIHGTNNPASIGTAASLGCVRMYNHDVEELFPNISIGTPVHISGINSKWSNAGNPAQGKRTYMIQSGDTLWGIAQNFNVSISDLIAVNNISNPDQIYPGQVIMIP